MVQVGGRWSGRERPVVLAYHALGDIDPRADAHSLFTPVARFRQQMESLAARRVVVPLEDVVAGVAPARSVAVTFDDGYCSVLEHAVPVLQQLGLPATVFVPTAYLGDRNRWNPPTPLDLSIMDADQLRSCEAGGVRVESHGHAHLDMAVEDVERVREDLSLSCEVLSSVLGRRPQLLAWPFRTASQQSRRVAEDLGFRAAFSIDLRGEDCFARPRVQISPMDGSAMFAMKVSGGYLPLRHAPLVDAAYRGVVKPLIRRRRWVEA